MAVYILSPERKNLQPRIILGFPGDSDDKESSYNSGDLGSIPLWGRSPGEGHGNSLQYSCLENSHEQMSLLGYDPWGCRVTYNWATKHRLTGYTTQQDYHLEEKDFLSNQEQDKKVHSHSFNLT